MLRPSNAHAGGAIIGRMRRPRLCAVLLASALCLATTATAFADGTPADADRAFQEGLTLFNAGRTAEACIKFAESQRIAPANGTLLNLAACHEKEGKRALAFREWSDLVTRAAKAGQKQREATARQRAAELGAKIPFVRLRGASTTNVEQIRLDDEPLDKSAWEEAIALDQGHHTLVFSASGRRSATKEIDANEAKLLEIDIPTLESDAASPSAAPIAPPATHVEDPPPPSSSRATVGWITGGAGLALVGVGTYFGVDAISKRSESDDNCPNGNCNQDGVDRNDDAKRSAWIANICIGVGLVAIGVGVYLIVTGRPEPPKSASVNTSSITIRF
jgi:hypothetical protein